MFTTTTSRLVNLSLQHGSKALEKGRGRFNSMIQFVIIIIKIKKLNMFFRLDCFDPEMSNSISTQQNSDRTNSSCDSNKTKWT